MTSEGVARGVGVMIALGFMTLSALINWRYGMTLARVGPDQWILAGASLLVDLAKAVTPFFVLAAMRWRQWMQGAVAALFWLVCTGYSLSFLIGYSEQHRTRAAGELAARKLEHLALTDEFSRRKAERDVLGTVVPWSVSQATIVRLRRDQRWASSGECASPTGAGTRKFCEELLAAERRLQEANEAKRLDDELRRLVVEIAARSVASTRDDGDPRSIVMARLFGLPKQAADLVLLITFVSVMEIGSGLGLFIALGKARSTEPAAARHDPLRRAVAGPGAPVADVGEHCAGDTGKVGESEEGQVADVAKFARARLQAEVGATLTLSALRRGYEAWCGERGAHALPTSEFAQAFDELAGLIGVRSDRANTDIVYLDVALSRE